MSSRPQKRRRSPPSPDRLQASVLDSARLRGEKEADLRNRISVEENEAPSFDSAQYECGSSATRCSLKLIHEVVSRLDLRKRQLVKMTGFDGILHFPLISQLNRKFAMWLMCCVDEFSRTLTICDNVKMKFQKEDVVRVFGIPCGVRNVLDPRPPARLCKKKVLTEYLGDAFRDSRSIKVLQDAIDRPFGLNSSKAEEDSFCVAFVVFVVSTLLSPSAKYDYASIDYWSALEDPGEIVNYDWAEFVIVRLTEAVSKLKGDLASGIKFPNITGCSLFLQVLFLDSLDIGELTMKHDSFPRIRHFSFERLRLMIRAAGVMPRCTNGMPSPVQVKLRDPSSSCYTWSDESNSADCHLRSSIHFSIWELTIAMARLLNVPLEAAGPLYVAVANLQGQVDSGLHVTGTDAAIKYMSVLLRILLSFKSSYSYRFSIHDDADTAGAFLNLSNDVISSSVAAGLMLNQAGTSKAAGRTANRESALGSSVDGSSDYVAKNVAAVNSLRHHTVVDNVQQSVCSAMDSMQKANHPTSIDQCLDGVMSRFYSLVRKMKLPAGIDLNSNVIDMNDRRSIGITSGASCSLDLPSPWSLGYSWTPHTRVGADMLKKLARTGYTKGLVVMHRVPKFIQVTADSFFAQMTGDSEFELDLFDATVRCVRQQDDLLYKHTPGRRWRHYFESDFMGSILSGTFDLADSHLINHFCAPAMSYDISSCRLLFFPALLQFRWVCYVWCMRTDFIYVFDPTFAPHYTQLIVQAHQSNCFMLKIAMQNLCQTVIQGWNFDWLAANMRITTWSDYSVSCFNRSGLICALFCRCFDSEALSPPLGQVDVDAVASKLVSEIAMLDGNEGDVPLSCSE